MRRLGRYLLRAFAALVVLLLAASLAAILVLRSGWFHEKVRARIVQEITRATGAPVELGQFNFDWQRLTATVGPLVIHGKEGPTEQPFVRVQGVQLGLRIISAMARNVDLASVQVDRPEVHIVVYADGSNNIPSPGRPGGRSWAEQLLNIRIKRYEITNGIFELDQRRTPFNIAGEDFHVVMNYRAGGPAYDGRVISRRVRIIPVGKGPIEAGVDSDFVLDKDGFQFPRLDITTAETTAHLKGALHDVRTPFGEFDINADLSIREAVGIFALPIGPRGKADFTGKIQVNFGTPFQFGMQGHAVARGVGYVRDRLRIENATVVTDIILGKDSLVMNAIDGLALGARVKGRATLTDWRQFKMDAEMTGLDLRQAVAVFTDRPIAWSGTLNGPVHVQTSINGLDAKVQTQLMLAPSGDGQGVEGSIQANYDRPAGTLELGSSWVAIPSSRVDVSGILGSVLQARVRTTNPDDLLPAIALGVAQTPATMPLKLINGVAIAEGSVSGPMENLHFSGQVSATSGSVEGHAFDHFGAQIEADRQTLKLERISLGRGNTELAGSATLSARNDSYEDSAIVAALSLRGADVATLLKEAGSTLDASGLATATARITGTIRNPEAAITTEVAQPQALGERFDLLRASLQYKSDSIEITSGEIADGAASLRFGGTYHRTGADWKSGEVSWDAATQNLPLNRIDRVARVKPQIDAVITGRARGSAQVSSGQFLLRTATVDLAADRIEVSKVAVGNLALGIETKGNELQLLATGRLRESTIQSRGNWTLSGNYPGAGTLLFSRMDLDTAEDLAALARGQTTESKSEMPFEGFLEGSATFDAPLRAPEEFKAEITLSSVQVNPKPNQAVKLGVQPQDIVLRNERPVVIGITAQEIRLRDARFTGRDTSIQASGGVPLKDGSQADFLVRGNVNLILLQLYHPDLVARGDAAVEATIRGNLSSPELIGRLELKGASVYFADLPNGLDNVNGTIVFDRDRATIEKVAAETGGGMLTLAGTVDFGPTIVYRLQATARQVRVRWPEDLSTTYNARLGLVGNSEASTLSGTVTLTRAAFNPRTDLGQLLAAASKPTPTPSAPSGILSSMQLDVRVENEPNFTFETSLTRDVQAEVDLNLHGTPLRPVLLGNVTVNQGEVEVFGNRYTIDRGEVHFLNPVKIDPTFDMDLETRARGIAVNVSLSGTMQQLKVNYSSDPPLQSSEIINLLAVGRDPASASNTTVGTSSAATGGLATAGSSLLGQAVNAQISSRLQRFFGASRVKIDPTLTGVDNLPQARLTIEQQVSKDITLTYITNLNRTQEQVVRIQYDVNRNWSAIAVRDQYGLFGIDFQYRTRF